MDKHSEFHYFEHDEEIEIDDEDGIDRDDSLENENDLLKELDPDVIEYLSEARIIKKTSKKKRIKKEKIKYKAGQTVLIKDKIGSIFYGPYDKNNKTFYEVEIDGEIRAIEHNKIQLP